MYINQLAIQLTTDQRSEGHLEMRDENRVRQSLEVDIVQLRYKGGF